MGILDAFKFKFNKSPTLSDSFENDSYANELSKNLALKASALNKVSNYIARSFSKAKFVIKGELDSNKKSWLFCLNVQPNPNQSSSVFLGEIAKKLIADGEVLIVSYQESLYIADSFSKKEARLTGNVYSVDSLQGITIDKAFASDDVIYLQSENENLNKYSEQLWADYGELLGRLINRQKTANQIRFTLGLPKDRVREKAQEGADGGAKDESRNQRFFERVVERIKNDSVVPIPLNKDGTYNEFSNRYSSKASFVEDIKQVKNQYVDELCEILGIPSALIHGELADNQKNHEQLIEVVIEPMMRKLLDGLQVAIFTQEEYLDGQTIKATGLMRKDLFDIASSGDKLIAAGLAMADEIREEIGLGPLPNGLGQRLYITKNYLELREEGGTKDENSTNQGTNHSEQS
ncbi:TPA: phage portal protein [Streptococcus suis]|uniref:phage portal protein n=1 Tax=Streptococcus suis TaxID=1307 RepID=UPI0004928270|nr:phage portal protein [Streptococcus suis]HEL2279041.1 phage portal protein [Streptococcus suis]HEL2729801.1 phage portal protein [Streptococcus suis]HEL9636002.1 phage portal protein [Streptococcus suis]HEP1789841.1 phage portal protein [Streptococcus suis]